MLKETTKPRNFITRCLNKNESWYCWYNAKGILTKKGLEELVDYVHKHPNIRDLVVVNNIETTRPQRTWGGLPEWFRPASAYNSFGDNNYNNHFIFVTWNDGTEWCDYDKETLTKSLESFPTKSQIIIIKGANTFDR